MPEPPALAARQGTAFHSWVEEHFSRAAIVDLFDLPGSADEGATVDRDLDRMRSNFLVGEWAERIPEEIELSIETVVDGIAIRGRIDAVFPRDDGGWTVVDWKTGAQPAGQEAEVRAIQLATYALAFARLRGVDPSRVDAGLLLRSRGSDGAACCAGRADPRRDALHHPRLMVTPEGALSQLVRRSAPLRPRRHVPRQILPTRRPVRRQDSPRVSDRWPA